MGVPTSSYKTPEPLTEPVQAARLPWRGTTGPESQHSQRLLWHRGACSVPQEATLQQATSVLGSEWGHKKKLLCVSFPLPINFPLSPSGSHPWVTIPANGVLSTPLKAIPRWPCSAPSAVVLPCGPHPHTPMFLSLFSQAWLLKRALPFLSHERF